MNIVKSLGSTEQFNHYLKQDGTILSVQKTKELTIPQSLSVAIELAKGVNK
tara:strand:+ start:2041 stop:2193 length:153 start_codon:yes stop_codon:yes gene_type:complete